MSIKIKRLLWPVLVVILVAIVAFTVASTQAGKGGLPGAEINAPDGKGLAVVNTIEGSNAPASPAAQEPGLRGVAQVVRFTVYDSGIYPREARVNAGLVAIQVEDMAGDSLGVVIRAESRQVVGQIMRVPHRRRGNGRLRLQPGRYRIHELNNPASAALLIVEP